MTETTDVLTALRKPFAADLVGKLPRVTCGDCSDRRKDCTKHNKIKCGVCQAYVSEKHIHIDYVGHADVTARLLDADPEWSWEPRAKDVDKEALAAALASGNPEIVRLLLENAPPKFDLDDQGAPVGLWIKLTVGGVTRPGYGSAPSGQSDVVKVLIGDALRNAAMRFGVALDLWAKGDRADPTAENATASAGRANRSSGGGNQSAGDVFEEATPAPPRQNGNGNGAPRGQVSRPAAAQPQQPAGSPGPEDVDEDAQELANEAYSALTLSDVEDIHRRAREAEKLTAPVRNPSSDGKGKSGKLAVYLDWKRKQIKELDEALTGLTSAAAETGFPVNAIEDHVKSVTGTDLEIANVAQIRHATQALRNMQGAAV
jgi:hypothetical protein